MTKNTIEFSEQPLHDPLTQFFIQDFCNKCSVGADMSQEQFKNFWLNKRSGPLLMIAIWISLKS